MALTTVPASSLGTPSVPIGSCRSALDDLKLRRRLEHWFPVLTAMGRVSPSVQLRTALWYSGLGSRFTADPSY